jgi:hypothetical protein
VITAEIEKQWLLNKLNLANEKRFAICLKNTNEYIGNIHKKALLDDNVNGLYYCYSSRGGQYTRIKECEVCQ